MSWRRKNRKPRRVMHPEGRPAEGKRSQKRGHTNRKREEKRAKSRNGCGGKKRYDTATDARDDARRMMIARRIPLAGVYLCDCGPHFHVTSRPRDDGSIVFLLEVES